MFIYTYLLCIIIFNDIGNNDELGIVLSSFYVLIYYLNFEIDYIIIFIL